DELVGRDLAAAVGGQERPPWSAAPAGEPGRRHDPQDVAPAGRQGRVPRRPRRLDRPRQERAGAAAAGAGRRGLTVRGATMGRPPHGRPARATGTVLADERPDWTAGGKRWPATTCRSTWSS